MSRLPTVHGVDGTWGIVLNDFLEQAHKADGLLKADVQTIAALKAIDVSTITDKMQVMVGGYYVAGDGGGGQFYYDAAASDADDAGTVIAPTAGSGRWKRIYSGAVNVRWFGAKGDDSTNDATALQAALTAALKVHVPVGIYRYGTVLNLRSGQRITADEGATLKWTGSASTSSSQPTILLREAGIISDPSTFSSDVSVEGVTFASVNQRLITILAVNIRGVSVRNCTFNNCGGLRVAHERQMNGAYVMTDNSGTGDPAVTAGFSSTTLDDLNEDVTFLGNTVNGTAYLVMGCRLDFCRRFAVSNNICKYASISWWGGSARNDSNGYGGLKTFLRRCTQGTISNNYCSWANGGIYGNNASHLAITGNVCEFIVDTGIDLEECMFCTITGNTVKYCGNFCMSTFYVTLNNIFMGNICIQGASAASMNTQAGTTDYPSSLGRHLFKQVSAFAETELNTISFVGNQFVWDSSSSFGVIQIDSRTSYLFDANTFRNVVLDGRTQAPSTNGSFTSNKLTFSNTPATANSVYIALGSNQDVDTLLNVSGNIVNCTNEAASTIIFFTQAKAFNGLVVTRIEKNTKVKWFKTTGGVTAEAAAGGRGRW